MAAAHRALQDEARGKMVTKNLHSELVHTLSGAHHVRARVRVTWPCVMRRVCSLQHRCTHATDCGGHPQVRHGCAPQLLPRGAVRCRRCHGSDPLSPSRLLPSISYASHDTHARTRHTTHNRQLERLKGLVQGKETEVDQFKKHTVITKALQVLLLCSAPLTSPTFTFASCLCFTSTTRSVTTRR
mgnify:CR=1 FL=1